MINFQSLQKNKGFTLIEMLAYVAIAIIVLTILSVSALWAIKVSAKIKADNNVIDNARRAMETIVFEIKKSSAIYAPTSVFNSHPGQLSLHQKTSILPNETTTYADIFLCGQSLCLKRESANPISLTNDQVQVTNLSFTRLFNSASSTSIQINIQVETLPSDRFENQSSINLTTTANMRTY
jgi:type II secretory pathway pseudopilin PulG